MNLPVSSWTHPCILLSCVECVTPLQGGDIPMIGGSRPISEATWTPHERFYAKQNFECKRVFSNPTPYCFNFRSPFEYPEGFCFFTRHSGGLKNSPQGDEFVPSRPCPRTPRSPPPLIYNGHTIACYTQLRSAACWSYGWKMPTRSITILWMNDRLFVSQIFLLEMVLSS